MPVPSRTYQKASGMYYIRLLVPKRLIPYTNHQKIIYSLKTKDRSVAYVRALKINLAFEEWLSNMIDIDFDRIQKLVVNTPSGSTHDFNMAIPEEKEAYYDLVSRLETLQSRSVAPEVPAVKPFTLEEGFDSWQQATKKTYSDATQAGYYSRVKKFISYAHAKNKYTCAEIDDDFAIEYRQSIDMENVSPLTVDNHTKSIKQFFDYVIKIKKYQTANPFANIHLVKKSQLESVTNSYIAFKPEELALLFKPDLYYERFKKPDQFYSPLIALTMGLRLEEVAQLHVADIYEKDNVWVIDINDDGKSKDLKTASSKRILPIPRFILSTNFLEYHSYIKKEFGNHSHLYPYLIKTKNGYGKNVGYNFTKHKQKLITVNSEQKSFHSLRKTLGKMMDDARYPSKLRKSILGHHIEENITDEIYGSDEDKAHSNMHTSAHFILTKLGDLDFGIDFSQFQYDFMSKNIIDNLVVRNGKKKTKLALRTGKI